MIAEGQAEDDSCRQEPPAGALLVTLATSGPRRKQHQQQGCEEDVQGVWVGAQAPLPGHGRDPEGESRQQTKRPAPRRLHRAHSQQGSGSGHQQG